MRVCIINPPRIHPKNWGIPSVFQPVELAYIAAFLEKQHNVCIIDAAAEGWRNLQEVDGTIYRQGLTNREIEDRIRKSKPDVVVITVPFSGWWKPAYEVASIVKSIDNGIVTMLTGLHPSARPSDCLSHPNIDFAILGEPEQTVFELTAALEQRKSADLKNIKGIAFVKDEKITITPPRPAIEDLDTMPFPARHLLPMETYFEAVKEIPLRGEMRKPWANIITSRGCPHHCVFCSIHVVMGRKWRFRSPENVVDEIEQMVRTYHIKQLDFNDDNMTFNKERMRTICDLMVKRGFGLEWYTPNGVRADGLDEDLLRKMKASGCKKLRIAPESGVQQVLDNVIKKNLKLEDVEKAIILCKKVGIKVGCFFVIGLIGETKDDIKGTINFAYKLRKLGANSFIFSIATPVYGTELYEQAKQGGFLRDCFSDEALSTAEPLIETPEFTAEELRALCVQANMVNPTFTFDKLKKAIRDPKIAVKFLLKK
jgi:anaerobic magnesium-protoporphyrin IX monomethyl ester cyclase